jgi:hypothetical protein
MAELTLSRREALAAMAALGLAGPPAARAAAPPLARAAAPPLARGMTLAGWDAGAYAPADVEAALDTLKAGGVTWISLVTAWYAAGRQGLEIKPDTQRTPTEDSLRAVIRAARRRDIKVLLKPQLDLLGPGWRGEVAFTNEDDWRRWFATYTAFIGAMADLAREEQAAALCVGVELDATRGRESDWRAVIAEVRRRFGGTLTYAANWGRETDIRWWDALDVAGVDAYFSLAPQPGGTVEQLKAGWAPHLAYLRAWQQRLAKPIWFTELGFRSIASAAVKPWEWQQPGQLSLEAQARCYQATIDTFRDEAWLGGLFWWQWNLPQPTDPAHDDGFSPAGKPAWEVLSRFYRG